MPEDSPESSGSRDNEELNQQLRRLQELQTQNEILRQESERNRQEAQAELEKQQQGLQTLDALSREEDSIERRNVLSSIRGVGGGEVIKDVFENKIAPRKQLLVSYLEDNNDAHLESYRTVYYAFVERYKSDLVEGHFPSDPRKQERVAESIIGMSRILELAMLYIPTKENPHTLQVVEKANGSFRTRKPEPGDALERSSTFVQIGSSAEDLESINKNNREHTKWNSEIAARARNAFTRYTKLITAHRDFPENLAIQSIYRFCVDNGIEPYKENTEIHEGKLRYKRSAQSMSAIENAVGWLEIGLTEFEKQEREEMPKPQPKGNEELLTKEEATREELLNRLKEQYKIETSPYLEAHRMYMEEFRPKYNEVFLDKTLSRKEKNSRLNTIINEWATKMDRAATQENAKRELQTAKKKAKPKTEKSADSRQQTATGRPKEASKPRTVEKENNPERNASFEKGFTYFLETVQEDNKQFGGSPEYISLANDMEMTLLELWMIATEDSQYFPRNIGVWRNYTIELKGRVEGKYRKTHARFLSTVALYQERRSKFKKSPPYESKGFVFEREDAKALKEIADLNDAITSSPLASRYEPIAKAYEEVYNRNVTANPDVAAAALGQWKRAALSYAEATRTAKPKKENTLSNFFKKATDTVSQGIGALSTYKPGMDPIDLRRHLIEDSSTVEFTPLNADQLEAVLVLRLNQNEILGPDGRLGSSDDLQGDSLKLFEKYGTALENMKKARRSKITLLEQQTDMDITIASYGIVNNDTFDWILDAQGSPTPYKGLPAGTLIEATPRNDSGTYIGPEEEPIPLLTEKSEEKESTEVAGLKILGRRTIEFPADKPLIINYETDERKSVEGVPLNGELSIGNVPTRYFSATRKGDKWIVEVSADFDGSIILESGGKKSVVELQTIPPKETLASDEEAAEVAKELGVVFARISAVLDSDGFAYQKKLWSPAYRNFSMGHQYHMLAYKNIVKEDPADVWRLKELVADWKDLIDAFEPFKEKPKTPQRVVEAKEIPKAKEVSGSNSAQMSVKNGDAIQPQALAEAAVPAKKVVEQAKPRVEKVPDTLKAGVYPLQSNEQFKEFMENPEPVIIKFEASWCGYCHSPQTKSVVRSLSKKYPVLVVDIDMWRSVTTNFSVSGIPDMVKVHKKQVIDRVTGQPHDGALR
ncbi:MAG: thioredoxin family protein [bacterium]|nr:thioredoxin family protein [bacterium]